MTGEKGGWIYVLSNRKNGSIYTGVTNNLVRRIGEHREGTGAASSFTRRYYIKRLVYFERRESIADAIDRETKIEKWFRSQKVALIEQENPEWLDLYTSIL